MKSRYQRTRDSLARSLGGLYALALLGTLLCARPAHGQNGLRFTHLSTEDGLPAPWVFTIFQDSRGFMWFGTINGLGRYDGYSVVAYRHQRGDSTSMPGNAVAFVKEDRDSVLWVGSRGGLSRYDRERNSFTNYVIGDSTSMAAYCMVQLQNGMMVLGSSGALYQFDPATGRSSHYFPSVDSVFDGKETLAMFQDSRGHLWLSTEGAGLIELDIASGKTTQYVGKPTDPTGFPDVNVHDAVEDRAGMIWAATYNGGLVRIDPLSGGITRFQHDPRNANSLAVNAVQALALNGASGLWIGLDNGGIDHLDFRSNTITHNSFDPNDSMGLSSGSIWSLYEDKIGTLWAGTFSGGINMAKRYNDGIRSYHTVPSDTRSLSSNAVVAFAQDSGGAIWVGTDGAGLNRFDVATKQFTRFTTKNGGVNSNAVIAVAAEPGGAVWIGTWAGGVSRLDPVTRQYTAYTTKNSNIPSDNVFSVLFDRRERLWAGTLRDGLLLFNPHTKSFTTYPTTVAPVPQSQIWVMHELHDGRIALGTLKQGLIIFDPDSRTMTAYRSDVNDPNSLASNEVRAIREGPAGVLWVGTGEGLERLDLATKKISHITAADGVLGTSVSGITIDGGGDLWLSTNVGITRWNPATKTSSHYSTVDGLQGRDFTARAYLQGRDGMMLFGGNQGFSIIRPELLTRSMRPPSVVITGFRLLNEPVAIGVPGSPLTRDISVTRELTLSYLQSVFTFEFAALDFTAPSKNQYAYMLEGFDKTWIRAGSQRSVTYTGLPTGHYVFRVKGSNSDGVWNDTGASIQLTISPPFWRTLWFRTLITLLVAGCVGLIIRTARQRHRYLKDVNARLAEAAEHDREVQLYLEGNVLDILDAMHKFSEGDYSVSLAVESDDAIGDLRKGFNGVVADHKRVEEELRQSQKMEAVGRLAGGVAHDFNNLLTVIVCNTALALEEAAAAKPVDEELKEIERAAVRASGLTRQLLAFSRNQILQPRVFSLNQVANDLGQMLSRTLGEDIDLRIVLEPALALVRADPGQIERVLMNLVMNARDAMPRGGTLLIQTRNVPVEETSQHAEATDGAYVELMVRDAGTGMSAEVKQRIFEPFFTTKEQGQGTGLGLSTVYGIVKQSGGYVRVSSVVGEGTTFFVYLPRIKAAVAAVRDPEIVTSPRGAATVLLVEDEDSVRALASRVLTRGGYTVLAANCGVAALDAARHFDGDIDLLLTDIVMPGMSGRELAEQLVLTRPDLRVLFASGYTEDAIVRHGVSSEAVAFLAKPFTPVELLQQVHFALESPLLTAG